ncbi:hypothetical protein ACFW16_27405 [Inquilinus sp. NPDC058860]|uniref:hypothetical protein n=1 Tax=Inquilinus sp. NPDC058860 TaxID=3346652 RepID=UPI0036C3236F
MYSDWKQQVMTRLRLLFSAETYALALRGYSALTLGFAILLGLFLTGLPTAEGEIQRAYGLGVYATGHALLLTAGFGVFFHGLRIAFQADARNVFAWAMLGLFMMFGIAVGTAMPVSWALMLIARAAE